MTVPFSVKILKNHTIQVCVTQLCVTQVCVITQKAARLVDAERVIMVHMDMFPCKTEYDFYNAFSAYFTTTFFPPLIYTPFRVGGDERRWPERVCQEEIVASE